jgi:hypothetical protein
MDEQSLQLVKETHVPIPAKPGTPAREDHEYERNGTANIFMFAAPLENWRRVDVTESRTAKDWAEQIRKLVDEDFPEATRIRLVMDNLNTHGIAEIELSALTKQCLGRRIPDLWTLSSETVAWEQQRNESQTGIIWRFTTQDARIKLKHLYPEIKA